VKEAKYVIGEMQTKVKIGNKPAKLHTHPEYEIQLFLKGSTRYIVEEKIYNIEACDMIIVRKNQFHAMYRHVPVVCERVILGVPTEFFIENNCQEYENQFLDEAGRLNNKIPAHVVRSSGIFDAFMRYKKYSKDYTLDRNLPVLKAIIIEILYLLSKCSEFAKADESNGTMKEVISYLGTHYMKDITLDGLCNQFYLSKYYLCRGFRKATGLTVFEYVRKKRLAKVAEFTANGMAIGEAAMQAGFRNYTAFYRAYKAEFENSPRKDLG